MFPNFKAIGAVCLILFMFFLPFMA